MRLSSRVFVVLGLAAGLALEPFLHRSSAVNNKPLRWLFARKAAAALAANTDVSGHLDGAESFVMSRRPVEVVPASWKAVPVRSFKSFDDIKNAFADHELSSDVKGVTYDYEKWRFTPAEEQQNPAGYVKQAAELVHARGLLFFTAPAVDLVPVLAPDSDRKRQDETYLRLGLAADAARYADVVDIQAQRLLRDTQRYLEFVRTAAAQARGANPKVLVLAGVSTQPGGQEVAADDIVRAIEATRDVVDGYRFKLPVSEG